MSTEYENLEKVLRPTRKSRGVLLVLFFFCTGLQIVSTHYLSENLNHIVNSLQGGYPIFLTFIDISMKLRYAVSIIGLIGIFHTRITPWTLCTTLNFFTYIINMLMRFYMVYATSGAMAKFKTICLVLYELESNLICFGLSLLFVYQSFCIHSEDKVSLDMEDPSQVFVKKLLKSLLAITPGVGFFRRKVYSAAKLDLNVC